MESWRTVPSQGEIPRYTMLAIPIQKSEHDIDREYRMIQLDNGLKAVLVHDPSADKAAACLEVAVGSLQDPDDMPGLAHFCEHMLSKGSEPFPAENDFLSFITSNGGSRNAGTGFGYTNYWFSVGSDLLADALPRLAAFFHSPLFTPSVTAREINAVDSENKKNLQNDQRRISQLEKCLSVPGHPWRKFGTGNIESLTEAARKLEREGHLPSNGEETDGDGGDIGRETRRRLVEWWRQQYCAGRMTLSVLGTESLDDLSNLTAKLFAPIRNIGLDPRPTIFSPPWGPSEMGTVVFVKTIKDVYTFSLTFPILFQDPHFRSRPARFVSHLIGHEGPGSIYAYLKKKGWVIDLSAGAQTWNRGAQTFRISGKLTAAGFEHYPDVLLAVYNYISLLRSSQLPTFLHEEVQRLSEIKFRFMEKTQPHTYVTHLVSELADPYYPPEWLLTGDTLVREWDEGVVREILEGFIPEKGRVMLMAKEPCPTKTDWETEKWYGTQYRVERLDEGLIKKAKDPNTNPELCLPEPNPFIPSNLQVQRTKTPEPAKEPTCVRDTPMSTLWHKRDDQFFVPKAHVKLDIRSPLAYITPRHAVLTRLLTDLVEDALAEVTYDAALAGLSYSLSPHYKGLRISLGGYNNKLSTLLRIVTSKVKNLIVDPQRLAVATEQVKREYENFYLAQPSTLSDYKAVYLLTPAIWTPAEKLAELPSITPDDVQQHRDVLLSRIYIESLVNGNIDTQQAVDLITLAEEIFSSGPLALSERLLDRSLILPEGANFVKQETVVDQKELNSSLTYYCHVGDVADARLRPVLDLVAHILREPCFSQLRTTEQLGYIVSSSRWSWTSSMGLCIHIQSLQDPTYLEERVDLFLTTFLQKMESLSEKEFQEHKEGLCVKKLERLKNLRQESSRFWYEIDSGYYNFIRDEMDAVTIRGLTLQEICDAYKAFIWPKSLARRKLSVHMRSQNLESPNLVAEGSVLIENENMFKASLFLSPSPIPVGILRGLSQDTGTSKSRL